MAMTRRFDVPSTEVGGWWLVQRMHVSYKRTHVHTHCSGADIITANAIATRLYLLHAKDKT